MFQQTLKNFQINLNALNERNTYSSGDLVTGHISFELTKATIITYITLRMTGKAHAHWSTGSGGKRGRRRRTYSSKVEYFDYKETILQDTSAVPGQNKLQPGRHVYQFTCQLPQGVFPSSFRSANGTILYSITMSVKRPWHLSKEYMTELNFVHRIDTIPPELHAPLQGTNSMTLCCLCCASGPLTVTARVDKKIFVPGETVAIFCNLGNPSSRKATPKVSLVQKQTFYTANHSNHIFRVRSLASSCGEPVRGATSVNAVLVLTIPTGIPLSITICSIIEVEYTIKMDFGVKASPDATVLFPIIIYDGPASTQPLLDI